MLFRTHRDTADEQPEPEPEPPGLLDWTTQDELIGLFCLRAQWRAGDAGLSPAELRRATFWRAMVRAGEVPR